MLNKKAKIAVSFGIVSVLLVWLVVSGFNENMQYYVTIKDLAGMQNSAEISKGLRVKGILVAGSVEKTANSLEVFFTMEEEGHELRVRYDQELPDTFKDGSEVLVEGKMTDAGYFDAKMLMAKCPSKYESTEEYNSQGYNSTQSTELDGTN